MPRAACAIAAGPALLLAVLAAPPAAAVETSTGVRCTIVGTAGADLLVGTSGRDVICGRGGADVIKAAGGNDLVDAGDGGDVVVGGPGADRVLAGAGGDDVTGSGGDDTVSGGPGPDDLAGAGGDDELGGGPGDDEILGGGMDDELDGQGGDDLLEGGEGGDDLDGGVGTNTCVVDAADESIRCKYDEAPPAMVETVLDPGVVDVTSSAVTVEVRVHATDDTGVEDIQVGLYGDGYGVSVDVPEHLQLVSGTERDGWWATTFEVPRYTRPVVLTPEVYLRDRLDRTVFDDSSPARLRVLDDNPDTTHPTLELVAPLGADPVDVRTQGADVTVSVRGTDDLAGVGRVDLCLAKPWHLGYTSTVCLEAVPRDSGTARNGVWTTTLRIPKGSPSGLWNVWTSAADRVHNDSRWLGPDAYRGWVEHRWCCGPTYSFGDEVGAFTVIGAEDRTPAWTDEVTVSPSVVDTLPGEATAHVKVRAHDVAGEGVTRVGAVLLSDSNLATQPQFDGVELVLTGGDRIDGTWEGDLVLPQGTPPGTYHVLVFVSDIEHSTGYVGTTYPGDAYGYQPLANDPKVVVEDTRAPTG